MRRGGREIQPVAGRKRARDEVAEAAAAAAAGPGGSVLVQFQALDGAGPLSVSIDVPLDISVAQLNLLLARYILQAPEDQEPQPHAFYVGDGEASAEAGSGTGAAASAGADSGEAPPAATREISGSLRAALEGMLAGTGAASVEASAASFSERVHRIRYQPLSVFRVLPVTRCSDTLPGHSEAILSVAFSPSGRMLASGGGDCLVRFWDSAACLPRSVAKGHAHHILAMAWSPCGSLFASADKAGQVLVWAAATGKPACTLAKGHSSWVTALAWEPLHLAGHGAAEGAEGCTLLASASKDGQVCVWNVGSGRVQFAISGHKDSIECLRWGGEGQGLLYTGSRDRTVCVWAVSEARDSAKLIRTLSGHGHRINSLALNTDSLCRTGAFDAAKASTAGGTEAAIASRHAAAKAKSTAAADGETSSSSSSSSSSSTAPPLSLSALVAAARARFEAGLRAMGGREMLVSCSDDFTLFLWVPGDGKKAVVRMTGHQQIVNHISFSPDGRFIASASFDKKVKLWCGRSGRFLASFEGHVGPVYQVCWSADSRLLASASRDSTCKVWPAAAAATGGGGDRPGSRPKALHTLAGHADEVFALDWSPAGDMLASGGRDRLLKFWRH